MVALTLPVDVLDALRRIHQDPGWAIVRLVESTHDGPGQREARESTPPAELVHLPGGRTLIVVQPQIFKGLRGVSTIPLADGRAFLAFDKAAGIADLEVAILDALELALPDSRKHGQLRELLHITRAWRRDERAAFRSKFIIVVEGVSALERRPLAPIEDIDAPTTSRTRRRRRRPS